MDTQEAYRELGLSPGATDAQLKATWRRLVAAWHPDRNAAADAGRRMQIINKAYQHIRQLRNGSPDESDDADDSAADTQAAAAQAASSHATSSGKTHSRKVRLGLEEAILGCTRTLRGHFSHTCTVCVGKGQRILARACRTCGGSGAVRKAALFGWLWNEECCADCGGDGRQREHCGTCAGSGQRSVAYRRRVRFPSGIRSGYVLSVPPARHGDLEMGLELHVEIEAHPLFHLDDADVLRCEIPVNGYAWMAGRWIEVPTPDGPQHMRLNRDALVYRLAGQGFPVEPRGARGDYMVRVLPVFPSEGDPDQDALLNRLIAASNRKAAADPKNVFGQWQRKLKSWKTTRKDPAHDE